MGLGLGGDFGAQVEPRCLEPRPLGKALTSFAYESPKPRESVPSGAWESLGTLAPGGHHGPHRDNEQPVQSPGGARKTGSRIYILPLPLRKPLSSLGGLVSPANQET